MIAELCLALALACDPSKSSPFDPVALVSIARGPGVICIDRDRCIDDWEAFPASVSSNDDTPVDLCDYDCKRERAFDAAYAKEKRLCARLHRDINHLPQAERAVALDLIALDHPAMVDCENL